MQKEQSRSKRADRLKERQKRTYQIEMDWWRHGARWDGSDWCPKPKAPGGKKKKSEE